jgi:chromosome segregation ATPase
MQLHNGSEVILARKQLTIIEQAYQDKDGDTDKLADSVSELMSIYHQTKAAKTELEETLSQLRRGLKKIQSALNALDPSSERSDFRAAQARTIAISHQIEELETKWNAASMHFSGVQESAQRALQIFGLILAQRRTVKN